MPVRLHRGPAAVGSTARVNLPQAKTRELATCSLLTTRIRGTIITTRMLATATYWRNEMPSIGEDAPDFALKNEEGSLVKLSDLKGRKVVLYFYTQDFTSG